MALNLLQFKEGLLFVLKWEGGYVNDPNDPGGETKYGISKRAHPHLDIQNLTPADAALVYFRDYWSKCGCSELDYPLNIVVFDSAVNCGVSKALHWLRESHDEWDYLDKRKKFYLELAKQDRFRGFLKGWLNRLGDLRKLVQIALDKQAGFVNT